MNTWDDILHTPNLEILLGDFKIKELIGILRMFINVIGGYHVIPSRNIAKLYVCLLFFG